MANEAPTDEAGEIWRHLGSTPNNRWRVSDSAVNLVRDAVPPHAVSLPAAPQRLTLDVNRSALVIIDMQNDFCHSKGWLASIGVDVGPARAPIAPLQNLLPAWRKNGGSVVWLNWGNRPDIQIDKHRMSGFWDTPLDSVLRNLGVTTLLFAGVNADQCVMCTLQDANFLGYDCVLLQDCTATTSPPFCMDATLYNVRQCFGFVADSSDLSLALR